MSTKEQYWKYSLITIIIGLGIILFLQITPFLGGLLGALTIYILVRRQMIHLTDKRKMKRSVAATLITTEAILFFLVPLHWQSGYWSVNYRISTSTRRVLLLRLKVQQISSRKKPVMTYWARIPLLLLSPHFLP